MSSVRRSGLMPLTDEYVDLTYRRVSTDDQEEDGMSLGVQDDETLAYHLRDERAELGGRYTDVDTGANPMRDDYQRMLAAARALRARGKRVRIIVVKQSRFGRDIEELGRAWRQVVKELDVEIHSTRDGGHIRDELTFLFRGLMNHSELSVISEGVRNSFARAREHGWLKPGRRRWGYRWEKATDAQRGSGSPMVVPVPDEHEAEYVRELFRRRADGASYRELAAWAQSLPDAARGRRKNDGPLREFSFSSIANILDSPVYIARNGELRDGITDDPPGKWEPLIDDETWRRVHPTTAGRENVVPISVAGEYLLTRFIFCEACGARMQGRLRKLSTQIRKGRTKPPSGRPKRQYVCGSTRLGATLATSVDGKPCHRAVPADTIERLVLGTFRSLVAALATTEIRERARKLAREMDDRRSATGEARRLRNFEDDRDELIRERNGLTRKYAADKLDERAYHDAVAEVNAEIEKLDAEIERLAAVVGERKRRESQRPLVDVILDQAPFWASALTHGAVDDQRAFLRIVLDRLTPQRIGPGEYLAGMKLTETGYHLLEVGASLMPSLGWHVEDVQLVWANCTTSAMPLGHPDGPLVAAPA